MGSIKSNPQVYDYRYALDYALCQGPIDSLNYVWIKDKRAFCGSILSREDICVNDDKLFGGDTAEGGIEGVIEYYPGTQDQFASMDLARRMGFGDIVQDGETPGPNHWTYAPAYQGIAHLFFRRTGYDRGGFKWGTNNPYLPGVKASVTRIPRGLWDQYASIRPLNAVYADGEVPDQQDAASYGSGAAFIVADPDLESKATLLIQNVWNNGPVASYILADWWDNGEATRFVQRDKVGICDVGYKETGLTEDALARLIAFNENGGVVNGGGRVPADIVRAGGARFSVEVKAQVTGIGFLGAGMLGVHTEFLCGQYAEDEFGNVGEHLATEWGAYDGENVGVTWKVHPRAKFYKMGIYTNPQWIWNYVTVEKQELSVHWLPLDHKHCDMDTNLGELPDANPAHIIYELLVDEEERDNSDLEQYANQTNMRNVAKTLFNEGFGVSIRQDQQLDRRALIKSLCEHVRGAVFQRPRTGQWDMKLFRNDYNFDTLPIITTADAKIVSGQRRAWSQCISEITVEYTDPQEEKKASVTSHYDAGAAITGNRVPEVRSYQYIRNSALAQIVADRDVVEASYPLWSGTIRLSRRFWETVPGDVYRLQYVDEDFNIADMVIRITNVDYGAITDRTITVEVVEDIYSVARTTYRAPQSPVFDPSAQLKPIRAGRPQYLFGMTLPYALVERLGLAENLKYPTAYYQTLIAANIDYDLSAVMVYTRSENQYEFGHDLPPSFAVRPNTGYVFEVRSRIPQTTIEQITPSGVQPGTILMFAEDREQPASEVLTDVNASTVPRDMNTELIEIEEFDPATSEWIVKRGMFDTVPRAWNIGETILINPTDAISAAVLQNNYPMMLGGYSYWGRSVSRGYVTSPSNMWRVPVATAMMDDARTPKPTRPANVKINGIGPEPLIDTVVNSTISDLVITWSSRNRLMEENDPPAWDDPNVIPEDGTTYTVVVRDAVNPSVVRHTEAGITETTFTLPVEVLAPTGAATVEVYADRAGEVSLFGSKNYVQVDRIALEWQGWGYNWGRNWGGAPLI